MRTVYALLAIVVVMTFGIVVMQALTGWPWIESFYFMAMLATAEGPPEVPPTVASEIFAGIMAFVSIGTVITATLTIFGPYFGYLLHKGVHFAEEEFKRGEEEKRKHSA